MGKFATLLESSTTPQKRKFTVHAQDEHGKAYKFGHESYGTKVIHDHSAFHPAPGDGPAHKLVKIMHGSKDVTKEHNSSATNESVVDNLDEKLKVLASGITASGVTHSGEHVTKTHNSPSRMQDQHKDTEYGQAHRKAAAEKIKAHRAETGQHGSKPFNNKAGFSVYKESEQTDESAFGTTPETQFHHLSSMPHKGGIRISGATRNDAHSLEDGKKHSGDRGHGHLVTAYHSGDSKDAGKSHFTVAHRDGNVVHFRDHKTGAHVATVNHSDLS